LLLIPAIAFAEACVGIGLLVSGIILVGVASVLYQGDIATISQMLPLAFAGAMLGDHAGFYAGRWIGPGFHHTKFAGKYQKALTRAENIIRRHGSAAIFIGRFVPAIRSLIPALLGISAFQRWRYTLLDGVACLLWSAALGGIIMGTGSFF
jgi:membrane-associated protein